MIEVALRGKNKESEKQTKEKLEEAKKLDKHLNLV